MAKNGRRRAAIVAAACLAVGASAMAARRIAAGPGDQLPQLELTPMHRSGSGTPLLLLHGVGGIWRAWLPVLPHLEPRHDVIIPTLPGHGGGSPLDAGTPPTVQALADAIENQLDRLGLQTVHIAGNSLGGWLAIELARRGRARSLILFSPAGAWRSQRGIELRAKVIQTSIGALGRFSSHADWLAANPLLRWSLLAGQVAHPDRVPREELAAIIRAGAEAPVVAPLMRQLPIRQVQPLPADRDYPVRLVWGERDHVIPFIGFGNAMFERLPQAQLAFLQGAGHVPMSDDPAGVAENILQVTEALDAAERADRVV
ncbi:alpha/beta fold hydrolase [Mycobacterium sp. OTB74]|uniref:alpha/beta fold hydrolase n=1 Tax=Mycobacterium sp. OTB74 TaxID=1853452 RepID=UPI002473FB01|nr:alpha/beta fold hydrolase [Mycobacterium sp. OTB74]MDH6246450.1 pimeloyl-ACP methyl ester carboxylesterase [Mycobacterium sp. OTB74]